MKRHPLLLLLLSLAATQPLSAQVVDANEFNQMDATGNVSTRQQGTADSLGTDKEVPEGLSVWTVDERFGDRRPAKPDTLSHLFMNSIFTSGMRGEYNTTGNLGAPREARIFIDRQGYGQFIFTQPYDYFVRPVSSFLFTNTLSPLTNVSYNTCGNRTNGEDHITTKFGVNAGKRIGVGFLFDYLYGRGYYSNQSTSHFDYTMYGSYLGDRYQAHILMSTNHQKVTENGGITDDNYITHPESYNESYAMEEIPTMLEQNWNRNDNQHLFFTQRYSIGFNRKVPMTAEEIKAKKFAIEAQKDKERRDAQAKAEREARRAGRTLGDDELEEKVNAGNKFTGRPSDAKISEYAHNSADSTLDTGRIKVQGKAEADSLSRKAEQAKADTAWTKNEFVPVTSFIHTAEIDNYRRIYEAYQTPENYYLNDYPVAERLAGDSIYDQTKHWRLRNTLAISLLEGFNKWIKAGAKAFVTHEFRHFALPDSLGRQSWDENALSVGGQLSKTQGNTLHFNATGEFGIGGVNAGEIHLDGGVDVNFPLFGDTLTLAASGFYHHEKPGFYFRHYQSRHFWWDHEDLSMTDHARVQGVFSYQKTRTSLRVAMDEINNYTYFTNIYTPSDGGRFGNTVGVGQSGSAISVFTAQLTQDFTWGPLNWENVVTFQKSIDEDVLPLPHLNVYSNLFLRFKIARVLNCDFGADARWFTKYAAADYVAPLGQYAVQGNEEKTKVGGYPLVNVYFNFKLGRARFFAMMSHVNAGSGSRDYFFAPHYPLNGRVFRFGISWSFVN